MNKKIVKQDGQKRVFICEDGTEIPFDKKIKDLIEPEKVEKKKSFFEKKEDVKEKDDNE